MMVAFIGCTEIYTPKIDSKAETLVIEGLITDGTGPFTIKLSKAILFNSDSVSASNFVEGAKLTVIDNENNSFTLTDSGKGNYTLPITFKARLGYSYKLHIETSDGNIYESNSQKLLLPQSYDSIRGVFSTNGFIGQDNKLINVNGGNILVDLFKSVSNVDSVPLCRFKSNVTIQYEYTERLQDTINWHWVYDSWKSFPLNGNENITEDNSNKTNALITGHSVCFMPIGMESYGLASPTTLAYFIYYLRIYQYTINKDSYNYYKEANNQLAASGKIFDPITSQLYGNMKCINNPSKIVLGLFEVSSVMQTAFMVVQGPYSKNVYLYKVPYVDIPSSGEVRFKVWDSHAPMPDDPTYDNITPSWWMHF